VNRDDAFRYEMGITRPSDVTAERLLAGAAAENGHNLDGIALFLRAVTESVPEHPDPALGAELVPRMARNALYARHEAETAAEVTHRIEVATEARRRPTPRRWSRFALTMRLGVAAGLLVLAMAGLAVAGVKLPGPVTAALSDLGLDLPNQGKDDGAGATVQGSSDAAHQRVLDRRAKEDATRRGKALGHSRGRAIGLRGAAPPGLAGVPNGPPPHSKAGGKGKGKAQSKAKKAKAARGRSSSAPGRGHTRTSPQGRGPR
jgi:hypothetical protein